MSNDDSGIFVGLFLLFVTFVVGVIILNATFDGYQEKKVACQQLSKYPELTSLVRIDYIHEYYCNHVFTNEARNCVKVRTDEKVDVMFYPSKVIEVIDRTSVRKDLGCVQ